MAPATKPILQCLSVHLIVPCSLYGSIVPTVLANNYNLAQEAFRNFYRKNEIEPGTVLRCSDHGSFHANFLTINAMVVLKDLSSKCNDIKLLEKCLYNLKTDFKVRKPASLGIFAPEEWIEEDKLEIATDLIKGYLEPLCPVTSYKNA